MSSRSLSVRLYNEAETGDEIPFNTLAQVLAEMQQAFYLLALHQEGYDIQGRARIPAEIERRYVLRALASQKGSYVIPAVVGNPLSGPYAPEPVTAVLSGFHELMRALRGAEPESIRHIVPDRELRRRILERVRSMIPRSGSGWKLEVRYDNDVIPLGEDVREQIGRLLKRVDGNTATYTVTGKLVKVNFRTHRITIFYPVTQRELDCMYDPAAEESLLRSRRELIQVTGAVTFDPEGMPKHISDVEEIRDIDLSPFVLSEFRSNRQLLRFRRPIEFVPALDDSQQLFCLEHPSLGIDICASTRDELDHALKEELDVLWRNYAMASPETLTPDAQEIRNNLLKAIGEDSYGAG